MPFMFLLAGFHAAGLYERHGARGFAANRVRRVVRPFLLAGAAVLPATYAVFAWGWWKQGRCTFEEIRELNFRDAALDRNLLGPGHLWFLEYLIVMYAVFWAVRGLFPNPAEPPAHARRPAWPVILMAATTPEKKVIAATIPIAL